MKKNFWPLFFLAAIAASNSHAARERVLSCDGKTQPGFIPVYTLFLDFAKGKFSSIIERKDGGNQTKSFPVQLVSQNQEDKACTFVLKQDFSGKERTLELTHRNGKVFLEGPEDSWFIDSRCVVKSDEFLQKLRACDMQEKALDQGILCRSESVDHREVHARIDTTSDVDYAEREIFSIGPTGKATSLGVKAVSMVARETENGTCTLYVAEKSETKKNKLNMKLTIDKKSPQSATAYVKEAVVELEDEETWSLSDRHRNMKCEISGELFKKVKKCEVSVGNSEKIPQAKKDAEEAKENKTTK